MIDGMSSGGPSRSAEGSARSANTATAQITRRLARNGSPTRCASAFGPKRPFSPSSAGGSSGRVRSVIERRTYRAQARRRISRVARASRLSPTGRWQQLLPDAVVVVAYLVAVALFAPFLVAGDGAFYYDLTRRFVGDGGIVYAYQWGTSVWNAPFYVVGHAIGLPHDVPLAHADGGVRFRDASITVAASVAALGAVLVARRVVIRLGLSAGALLLLGSLFGTELWFYGILEPSYTHAVDALAFSCASYFVVRLCQGAPAWVAAALGATLVALVTIRYANIAALPGFIVPFVLRRNLREAVGVILGGLVGAALLLALPLALGTGFGSTANLSRASEPGIAGHAARIDLLVPLKELVAPDRGLLAYAPLCGVASVGFVLAVWSSRRNRLPLISIGLAGLGILLIYGGMGTTWRGGTYSYGQRFLTSLTVVTLIGLTELYRRVPRATSVLVVLCTAWSLFIGINYAYGWAGVTNDRRNADEIVRLYLSGDRTPTGFARLVAAHLRGRFTP